MKYREPKEIKEKHDTKIVIIHYFDLIQLVETMVSCIFSLKLTQWLLYQALSTTRPYGFHCPHWEYVSNCHCTCLEAFYDVLTVS